MTRQTTQKTTDTGTTTDKVEQPPTNRMSDWTPAIQNPIDVPRAIHREIC